MVFRQLKFRHTLSNIPWDLYYDESNPEILDWKFPSPADPKENIDPEIYKTPEELQALSYPEKKGHLLRVLENDLNRIIPDLDALLSSESEHRESLRLLNGQLNDYFRNKYSRAVKKEDLEVDKKRIKLKLNHVISMLESKDFAPKVQASPRKDSVQTPAENMKKGGIWRKIPPRMKINTPTECKIKIAVDKSQLKQERAASDIKIRIDTIRTSNEMEVDLFEPPMGDSPNFDIKFMGSKSQLVDINEPTEWTFYVTPLKEGNCKLLLHVTIVEEQSNKKLVKVIPFEEEVEIVTYQPEELGVYEKVVILNFLPFAIPLAAGQVQKETEQPQTTKKTSAEPASASASASAGLGIGKFLAGLLVAAAVAALAWWGLQNGAIGSEMADAAPIQEEEVIPSTPDEGTTKKAPAPAKVQAPEPPTLANSNFSYDMTVEDNLTLPYEEMIEGEYLPAYTFKINEGGSSDKLDIAAGGDALDLKALQEGKHTIQFQICVDQTPCSTGNINININAVEEKIAVTETPPPPPPPATSFEYGTANGPSQAYNTVKIADTWWTRQNLNEPGGLCYQFDDNNCQEYGALYYREVADEACKSLSPGSWKLPTPDDWNKIKNSADNRNELSLKKGGYMVNDTSSQFIGIVGRFWSDLGTVDFEYANNGLDQKSIPDFSQLSCRCVKK